ncbi:MAG: hypothetical protein AAGA48_36740 [Myxococcota bacterium]
MVLAACNSNDDAKEIESDPADFAVRECERGTCDRAIVRFDKQTLADCFGWDPQQYPGSGWPPDAPAPLAFDWCNPDTLATVTCDWENSLSDVDFLFAPFSDRFCDCDDQERAFSCSCCVLDVSFEPFLDEVGGLSQEFLDRYRECTVAGAAGEEILPICQTPECDVRRCNFIDGIFSIAPDATHVLHVDPVVSTVTVTHAWGESSFALQGGASISTDTNMFLTGHVWAQDGNLGSHELTDWHWKTDEAFAIEIFGDTLSINSDTLPALSGKGYEGNQGWSLNVSLTTGANGTLDLNSESWALDFSQSSFGWDANVHLEGWISSATQ